MIKLRMCCRYRLKKKEKKLSDFLEQHKNHFIDFRYAFEENDKKLCVFSTDLGNFANCLRDYCLALKS